jgi:hypothetical protein
MINLQLTIQEAEAVIKHIEQSASALINRIHMQAAPQVAALQAQQKPVESTPASPEATQPTEAQ